MLDEYLPKRYSATKATVVDSLGHFSDQIDVVIFDRQYSPFIFNFENQKVVPAESIYAVFEASRPLTPSLSDTRKTRRRACGGFTGQASRYPQRAELFRQRSQPNNCGHTLI